MFVILRIFTLGKCLFSGKKRGGIWTSVCYSEHSLCVCCCVRPWLKGRQIWPFSQCLRVHGPDCCKKLGDINIQYKCWGDLCGKLCGDIIAVCDLGKLSQGDLSRAPVTHVMLLWKEILCNSDWSTVLF